MNRAPTAVIAKALRVLARDIKSPDNVPELALREAADRLDELVQALQSVVITLAAGGKIDLRNGEWSLFKDSGDGVASGASIDAMLIDLLAKWEAQKP